jgi:hypothetical protein
MSSTERSTRGVTTGLAKIEILDYDGVRIVAVAGELSLAQRYIEPGGAALSVRPRPALSAVALAVCASVRQLDARISPGKARAPARRACRPPRPPESP